MDEHDEICRADALIVGDHLEGIAAAVHLVNRQRNIIFATGWTKTPPGEIGVEEWANARSPAVSFDAERTVDAPDDAIRVREVFAREREFLVVLENGLLVRVPFLVLAPSQAPIPAHPGFREYFGRGVLRHWFGREDALRDQPLAVYGHQPAAIRLARGLRRLSNHVVLCTDGQGTFDKKCRGELEQARVKVIEKPVTGLLGTRRRGADRVAFEDGTFWPFRALFLGADDSVITQTFPTARERPTAGKATGDVGGAGSIFFTADPTEAAPHALKALANGMRAAMAVERALSAESRFSSEGNHGGWRFDRGRFDR